MINLPLLTSLGGSTLRMSAPLVFTALGGLMSERSGTVNIALEGKMLFGAFTAASVTFLTHSPLLGFLAGGLAGVFIAVIYGIFVIHFKANQIVVGMATTLFATGIIPILSQILFQNTGTTPEIPLENRLQHAPLVLAWVLMILLWLWCKYSPSGMWNKFAGEHPSALQTAGIGVIRTRWAGILLAGFFAGLGGATLSICLSSSYTRNMTAGRGYISLAALIIGSWKPIGTALACLAFGLFDALGITLQETPWLPSQLIQVIPYILTIIIVAGFVGKSRPPKALGQPY